MSYVLIGGATAVFVGILALANALTGGKAAQLAGGLVLIAVGLGFIYYWWRDYRNSNRPRLR